MKPCPNKFPYPLIVLKEAKSTNDYLNALCDSSEEPIEEFTTVYTDFQTAGKGQRGNNWESEAKKNLLFSFVHYPTYCEASYQFMISVVISLSIREELSKRVEDVSIKWPNDIYVGNKKIGGILIENQLSGSTITRSIIGVGLNINQESFSSDAPNPISLKMLTGKTYDLHRLLNNIVKSAQNFYSDLAQGHGYSRGMLLLAFYNSMLYQKWIPRTFRDANGEFQAQIDEVTADGHLILKDENGETRSYLHKEVEFC